MRTCLQGYAIGNPSADGSVTYNLNGMYQGFHLISPELNQRLDEAACPHTPANFNESAPDGSSSAGRDGALLAGLPCWVCTMSNFQRAWAESCMSSHTAYCGIEGHGRHSGIAFAAILAGGHQTALSL